MKKVLFALMCVAMMALVSSCAKSKTEIVLDEFENLIEEVEEKDGNLTAEEWTDMQEEFNQRFEDLGIDKIEKDEFSTMEKLKLLALTARWTAAIAKSAPTLVESSIEKAKEEAGEENQ